MARSCQLGLCTLFLFGCVKSQLANLFISVLMKTFDRSQFMEEINLSITEYKERVIGEQRLIFIAHIAKILHISLPFNF
jgi:hypothetical protein